MAMSKIALQITSDPTGLTRGVEEARRALQQLQGDMSKLNGTTAGLKNLVGFNTFLQVANIAKSAAASFLSMAAGASQSIDTMSKLAERTGRTYTEMAALANAGKLAGVGIDQLGSALTKADVMFNAAQSGSQAAQAAFLQLGLNLNQLGQASSQQRFEAIAAAIDKLPDPSARAAAAIQVFGKSGASLLPMFSGIQANLAQATTDAENFGLALKNVQGKDVEAMNDAWTRAGYAVSGVVTQVTAQLAPAVTGIVDLFSTFVASATGGAIGTAISEAVFNAGEILARAVDFWISGATIVANVVGGVFDFFASIIPEFATTANTLGIVAEVFQRAISLFEGIGKYFVSAFANVIGVFSRVLEYAVSAWANIADVLGINSEKLRQLQGGAAAMANDAFATGTDWAVAAGKDISNAFSADFKPTDLGKRLMEGVDGGAESMVERWRAASAESRAKADEATVKAGADAGAAMATAIVQAAGALDVRSKSGVNEIVRMMNGGQGDIAKRQLQAQERIADATEEMADAEPMVVADFG